MKGPWCVCLPCFECVCVQVENRSHFYFYSSTFEGCRKLIDLSDHVMLLKTHSLSFLPSVNPLLFSPSQAVLYSFSPVVCFHQGRWFLNPWDLKLLNEFLSNVSWKLRLAHSSDRLSARKEFVADKRFISCCSRTMLDQKKVMAAVIMACCAYGLRLACVIENSFKSIQRTCRLFLKNDE